VLLHKASPYSEVSEDVEKVVDLEVTASVVEQHQFQ